MIQESHRSCIDPYLAKGHLIAAFCQYYLVISMYTKTTIRPIILQGMITLTKTQMAGACIIREAMITAGGGK